MQFDTAGADADNGLVCGCDYFGSTDILFVMFRLGRSPPTWEIAVHMTIADDVFGGEYFYFNRYFW